VTAQHSPTGSVINTLFDRGDAVAAEEVAWRTFEQILATHPRRTLINALAEVHADVDEEMSAGMRWHLRRAYAVVEALPDLTLRADQ
jgi:hypothetical protein